MQWLYRGLPRRRPTDAAHALTIDVVRKIVQEPDLVRDPWDTFALIASVGEDHGQLNGYRYVGSAPPVPAGGDDFSLHDDVRQLRAATAGPDGATWDVAVVRVEAATGRFSFEYVSAPASADWQVTPSTHRRIAEAARPRPEHFS